MPLGQRDAVSSNLIRSRVHMNVGFSRVGKENTHVSPYAVCDTESPEVSSSLTTNQVRSESSKHIPRTITWTPTDKTRAIAIVMTPTFQQIVCSLMSVEDEHSRARDRDVHQ